MASSPNPSAILYSAGINDLAASGAMDEMAQRIARSLDHLDNDVTVTYQVRVVPTVPYGDGKTFAETREVARCSPGKEPVVTHRIYNLNYQPALADEQPEKNLFTQAWAIAGVWAWMCGVFFKRVLRTNVKSISSTQKIALAMGAFFLLVLTGYLAALFITAAQAAVHQLAADPHLMAKLSPLLPARFKTEIRPFYDCLRGFWHQWVSSLGAVLILAGLLGLSFGSMRKRLKDLINMFLSFSRYLKGGLGRSVCTGKFNDLLEYILEQSPSRVDIISYSMGSLITLDALCPEAGNPNQRAALVSTITTIGCPFDLVRTFWPNYFADRVVPDGALRWINIFSPVDLLGSNFSNEDGAEVPATRGINATCPKGSDSPPATGGKVMMPNINLYYDHAGRKTLDLTNAIFGGAYLAHSQYWVCGDTRAESCYNLLVPQLYPNGAAAAGDKQNNLPPDNAAPLPKVAGTV